MITGGRVPGLARGLRDILLDDFAGLFDFPRSRKFSFDLQVGKQYRCGLKIKNRVDVGYYSSAEKFADYLRRSSC